MIIAQWLSECILTIATLYQLAIIVIFCVFAMRIGHIKTIDDLIPEEGNNK